MSLNQFLSTQNWKALLANPNRQTVYCLYGTGIVLVCKSHAVAPVVLMRKLYAKITSHQCTASLTDECSLHNRLLKIPTNVLNAPMKSKSLLLLPNTSFRTYWKEIFESVLESVCTTNINNKNYQPFLFVLKQRVTEPKFLSEIRLMCHMLTIKICISADK